METFYINPETWLYTALYRRHKGTDEIQGLEENLIEKLCCFHIYSRSTYIL